MGPTILSEAADRLVAVSGSRLCPNCRALIDAQIGQCPFCSGDVKGRVFQATPTAADSVGVNNPIYIPPIINIGKNKAGIAFFIDKIFSAKV